LARPLAFDLRFRLQSAVGPGSSDPQRLTPLELLDRPAALVPPPRIHRHRYFGILPDWSRPPDQTVADRLQPFGRG
jgi:hypothetical protein